MEILIWTMVYIYTFRRKHPFSWPFQGLFVEESRGSSCWKSPEYLGCFFEWCPKMKGETGISPSKSVFQKMIWEYKTWLSNGMENWLKLETGRQCKIHLNSFDLFSTHWMRKQVSVNFHGMPAQFSTFRGVFPNVTWPFCSDFFRIYTTWKVDGSTRMYWFITSPY